MRLFLAVVGRERPGSVETLFRDYVRRLPWRLELVEVRERRTLPAAARRRAEGELLLGALPSGATVVVLDEKGEALSSEAFARRIGVWRDSGVKCLAFLVGGAEGHADKVIERADFVLSLGPMTWPHRLMRVLLAEQLYRAASILSGHPYHRA